MSDHSQSVRPTARLRHRKPRRSKVGHSDSFKWPFDQSIYATMRLISGGDGHLHYGDTADSAPKFDPRSFMSEGLPNEDAQYREKYLAMAQEQRDAKTIHCGDEEYPPATGPDTGTCPASSELLAEAVSNAKLKRKSYRLLAALNYKRFRPRMAHKGVPPLEAFEKVLNEATHLQQEN